MARLSGQYMNEWLRVGFLGGSTGLRLYWRARISAAAILGQIGQKRIHGFILGGIKDKSTFLARRYQARIHQFFQVKGQGRGRNADLLGKLPSSKPART